MCMCIYIYFFFFPGEISALFCLIFMFKVYWILFIALPHWLELGKETGFYGSMRVAQITKEINSEYPLEGLMLKLQHLAIWCKEPTHWKSPCCWERLRAGGEGGNRGWDGWMASRLNGHELKQTQGDSEDRETWCAAVHGVSKSWTRPSDWTRTDYKEPIFMGKETEGKLLT